MLLGVLAALLIPLHHASTAEAASVLQKLLPRRSLLQTPASDVPFVARFDTLLTQLGPGRPVTLKNVEAARLLSFAQAGAQASPEPSVLVQLTTGPVLVAWQNVSASAVIAFAANASSLAFNATEPGFAPASVAPLLQGDFAGAYAAGVASPFVGLVNGTAGGGQTLPQLIANVSDGQAPRRVVCTGYGNGGAEAELCGLWAAVTYPAAQIRTVAFGAPVVGNQAFAFAFQQLLDLSYLWSTSTHLNVTNATLASGAVPADEVRVLNDTRTVANASLAPNSWDQYVSAIIEYYNVTSGSTQLSNSTAAPAEENQGGISGFFNNVSNVAKGLVGTVSNFGNLLDAVKTFDFSGDESSALDAAQAADAAAARRNATGCPPLLCKMRPAATASCNVYNNGTGSIAPGSVQIGPVNGTGTQLSVAWNASARTATIVFKGSTTREDWITDFKLALNDANTNTALDQFFPDVQLHTGFLESLQSVTENAKTPAENITAVLNELSGGDTQPSRVLVSGHSLGGGVALIAGAWAALQWPAADVQVVTLGSPMPGNAQFAELFKLLVGRSQRAVHTLDVVPALPPLDDYRPVDYGRWIPRNQTVVVQDRPTASSLDAYNWDDHSCRLYEANIYRTTFATPPTNLGQALANTTTGGASAFGFAAGAGAGMSGGEGSGNSSSGNATPSSSGGSGAGSPSSTAAGSSPASAPAPAPQSAPSTSGGAWLAPLLIAAAALLAASC